MLLLTKPNDQNVIELRKIIKEIFAENFSNTPNVTRWRRCTRRLVLDSASRVQGIFPLTLALSPEYRGEGNCVFRLFVFLTHYLLAKPNHGFYRMTVAFHKKSYSGLSCTKRSIRKSASLGESNVLSGSRVPSTPMDLL